MDGRTRAKYFLQGIVAKLTVNKEMLWPFSATSEQAQADLEALLVDYHGTASSSGCQPLYPQ
jgi:hypothetical protein